MKLMKYETPSMETVSLENENIICASGEGFQIGNNAGTQPLGGVEASELE